MRNTVRWKDRVLLQLSLIVMMASVLAAKHMSGQSALPSATISGVVGGSYFTPPAGTAAPNLSPSYYEGSKVCIDANDDGICGPGENSTTTGKDGAFTLKGVIAPITAEIPARSTNAGHAVTRRVVFRAPKDQVSGYVVVSPLSTEVVRMMEADKLDFNTARARLAERLSVPVNQVLSDPAKLTAHAVQAAILSESVILTGRFTLAATMIDRHDPLAPTMRQAQQAVTNLEGIPRYDHLFIIMLENKEASSIQDSPFAPKINAYLKAGNQFTSYYATGNPSEPNYTALGAADDFGIADDENWNCVPEDDMANRPDDPLPAGMLPCVNPTNHNIKNKRNLFNAMSAAGMTWRVYSESMNPGRDWRLSGVADPSLIATDHVYPANSPVGAIGNANLKLSFPARLYATKHNPTVPFQNVRSAPEFKSSNRTMGGGQWDDAIKKNPNTPEDWDVDQLGTDLKSGDIANLNFLVPDQCDDMHGVKFDASDCKGDANIYRGDNYVNYLIRKIQDSAAWKNTQQRIAIVVMFDEGKATSGFNSCCGWNPSAGPKIAGKSLGVLARNANGAVSVDTSVSGYSQGNKGHGTSIFGVLTNQPKAPKGVIDSDAYSHFSFVRTIQDMFQLADPGDDWSYMNRSKYTEKFIAVNLLNLPEFSGSADTHFDAVRPMNHAYVIPKGYVQKNGFPTAQVGPDKNQINVWALK